MKRFAVIGMGRFGRKLAQSLTESGNEVIAIDINQSVAETMRDEVALAVRLDATNAEALKAQGVDKVDAAIVSIGEDFEANALTTATLKELGVRTVISRAATPIQAKILTRIGADRVINPEDESASRLGHRLANPNIIEHLELAEGHSLIQLTAPQAWHNKTLGQIDLRRKFEVNLVAIRRSRNVRGEDGRVTVRERIIDLPMAGTTIQPSDVLVIVGSTESLAKLPH
ncbi:MAG: TrkA family potassium uptake protein [Planctomycetia bacterium]|nr:TrkA family potassium uptake protein [Planctomycetia bacterium]